MRHGKLILIGAALGLVAVWLMRQTAEPASGPGNKWFDAEHPYI